MNKILIIGVGGAGRNIVAHMKKVGIPNAEYITMGDYLDDDDAYDIQHYNLKVMGGNEYMPIGAGPDKWRYCAERAEIGINNVLDFWLGDKKQPTR